MAAEGETYDFMDYSVDAHVGAGNETGTGYNDSINYDNYSQPYYSSQDVSEALFYYYLWTFITPAIFGLITVIGTAGNILVIYVILGKPGMRTVTNYMLLNLAFADISFLLICVPFTAYKYASSSWPFGDWACKIVQYFLYVTAYVTIYTLVAISGLRFATVVYSNQTSAWRTKSRTILLIILIWLGILLVNMPTLLVHKLREIQSYTFCGMESYAIGPVFVTFFIFAYALPLCAIILLYLAIVCHLRSHTPSSVGDASRDRTNRAFKVIAVVVAVFAVSWLPSHVNSFLSYFGRIPSGPYYEVFRILCFAMSYGNSCANPFIYNYASTDFRKAFKETMCGCLVTRSPKRGARSNGTAPTTDTHVLVSKATKGSTFEVHPGNDVTVPVPNETTAMIDKNSNNNPLTITSETTVMLANNTATMAEKPVEV